MKARKIVRNRRKMDEKGVSPVIGVILMVAATIVIAAVVLGMLGGFGPPKKTYVVAVSASRTAGGKVTVTFEGGPDASLVTSFSGTITNVSTGVSKSITLNTAVGSTFVSTDTYKTNDAHVVVSATFKDGSSQVVLNTYV